MSKLHPEVVGCPFQQAPAFSYWRYSPSRSAVPVLVVALLGSERAQVRLLEIPWPGTLGDFIHVRTILRSQLQRGRS